MKTFAMVLALAATVGAYLPARAPMRGALMRRSVSFADPGDKDFHLERLEVWCNV